MKRQHINAAVCVVLKRRSIANCRFQNANCKLSMETWGGSFSASPICKNPRGDDYYDVCEQLHGRLLDPQAKAPVVLFRKIEIWLGKHYLRKGRLDLGHGSPARRLVEQKAHRVWQRTGRQDSQANWDTALHYASAFYENILPAINEHDAGSLQQVLHALSPVLEPGTGCELVNSFEAAIVIEFLAPADIRSAYHPASSYL